MLQMMIATLPEVVEAFLIVAITAAYLRQTERSALLPAMWFGVRAQWRYRFASTCSGLRLRSPRSGRAYLRWTPPRL